MCLYKEKELDSDIRCYITYVLCIDPNDIVIWVEHFIYV